MKKVIYSITNIYPAAKTFHIAVFAFRVFLSIELIIAHGLKKIGVGVAEPEHVPNPLHLPQAFNDFFAITADLICPIFVILGLLLRLSVLPILAVTLTGYFIVHWHDPILQKDMPFMYSIAYLLILVLGPGKYSIDYFINKKLRS